MECKYSKKDIFYMKLTICKVKKVKMKTLKQLTDSEIENMFNSINRWELYKSIY